MPGVTKRQRQCRPFWTQFRALLETNGSALRKTGPDDEVAFARQIKKRAMFIVGASFEDNWLGVRLRIYDTEHAKDFYDQLVQSRAEINRELGFEVEWERDPHGGDWHSWVSANTGSIDIRNPSKWPEAHRWLLSRWEAFERTFRPRVEALVPRDPGENA